MISAKRLKMLLSLVFLIWTILHIQHQDKNILASLLQREAAAPTLFEPNFGKIHFTAMFWIYPPYKINNLSRTCIKSKILWDFPEFLSLKFAICNLSLSHQKSIISRCWLQK